MLEHFSHAIEILQKMISLHKIIGRIVEIKSIVRKLPVAKTNTICSVFVLNR